MKYLLFNITVAATLVYLVVADDFGLTTSPEDKIEAAQIEETNLPIIEEEPDLTLDDVRPLVDEMIQSAQQNTETSLSESEIRAIVTAAIEDAMASQAQDIAIYEPQNDAPQQSVSIEIHDEEPLEEIIVETPVTHAPPVETGGLGQPESTGFETDVAVEQTNSPKDAIQLAEGESLMEPKTRQKELDKLVSSLELMFLDKTH